MTWHVSGPDIFRREDRNTELLFCNQPNLCHPNQPFIFSANKGPPVPLHVEEANAKGRAEVESKAGIGNPTRCSMRPQPQQLVEVKAESSASLDHLFERSSMNMQNMGGKTLASNAFEHRAHAPLQNEEANRFWDPKQDTLRFHNIEQEMESALGFHFGMPFPEATSCQSSAQPSVLMPNQVHSNPNQHPAQNPQSNAQASHSNPLFDPSVCEQDFCELTFPELDSFSSLNLEDFDPNTLNEFLSNGL